MSVAAGPIILFDGVCLLCNRAVRFIAARDPRRQFRFAPLQSAEADRLLAPHGLSANHLNSLVLLDDCGAHLRSDAVLRIVRRLAGGWPLLAVLRFVPRSVRDWLYDLVARRRYAWFGQRDSCMIPEAGLAARFLSPHDSSGPDPPPTRESS